MQNKRNSEKTVFLPFQFIIAVLLCIIGMSYGRIEAETGGSYFLIRELFDILPDQLAARIIEDDSLNIKIDTADEGEIYSYASQGYRYGPSIIENEDGSYDAWFSSPGNNSSEWDWIRYIHSDDGENWSKEKIVLKPTSGSKDSCSVCDPGVIFFGGYYYLGYTSTDDYARKGYNNSAFVARSRKPEGPYEKWNGSGWGGKPQPIISYEGDPRGWGIGELSFVLLEDDLYIFYTYFDTTGGYTALAKAEACENWPETIEEEGMVLPRTTQDSIDVFYADDYKLFMAFSIENRMAEGSKIAVYASVNGRQFTYFDSCDDYIEDYAHNMGIAKDRKGHQDTDKEILTGYAYGRGWGRWNSKFQHITISNPVTYQIEYE